MKILVTGGAGFIGHHLCRALLHNPAVQSLAVVDSLHGYYDPARKERHLAELGRIRPFRFACRDILDEAAMDQLLAEERPDTVVHLAAIPGVRRSLAEPLAYVDVDVKGTVLLLEACRRHGISRFVFASSSSVYGDRPADRPFREADAGLSVASPYAACKLAGELFCRTFRELYGIDVTALRFFTVYGPEQRPDMAVLRFIEQLERGEPLTLYDPDSVRDYTYVEDVVRAILLALERIKGWQVYNVGSGRPVTLKELIRTLECVTGKTAQVQILGKQPGDVTGTWADTTAARQQLGWVPHVTLEAGLQATYEWWKSR